jgi:hypothetical protein
MRTDGDVIGPAGQHRAVLADARIALNHAGFATSASHDLPGTTGGELNHRRRLHRLNHQQQRRNLARDHSHLTLRASPRPRVQMGIDQTAQVWQDTTGQPMPAAVRTFLTNSRARGVDRPRPFQG